MAIHDGEPTDGNASFLRAARAGNLDKVLEYLKGSIDINTSNANGLNGLHLASKEGHVSVVTELLKRGANVDAATKKGNSALHIASLAGQEAIVKILVQHGASVNVQSQNGFTPLYMAAQENHDSVVRFLLSNNANQSLATEDGFTPLAVALQQGHDKVVAVLLENDTRGKVRLPALHIASKKDDCKAAALLLQSDHNPDVTSKSGFTPLHIAAHYGNENIANLLLQRGADVNYAAKHNITPMHVASKWGKPNMITLLLDKNATIDAKTRDGLTPLHCAARSGHDQVVDLMLDRGAPIMAKTKNGLAPLHMAAQGDHVDSARILLYHKAPVDDVTVDYLTALHVAAHCGHVRVAKLLLDQKADPNARALNGFTPLHIACKKNRIKVVELLLKHGASIEATTESGLTPLHVASFMGCMNIVIYLIQHGSNPDVPTVRGETPLHLAARANQIDIIRILLRNGAHVDARAREQQTILHIAARLGNADIVALLLQHGATVDATTKDMYTALHIAAKDGQEDVASVLLEHGASLGATTKKGFTPLHLAAKYGNMKVAKLLLQRDAPVDAQGKNGVTPLHVAAHYDHQNVATMLLDKGASPHATAKNGYTPLHIAAKKNQMDIATTLLEYGAKATAESKAGFSPLHLAAQEGHTDMCTLLLEHHADPNSKAKNGLTPMHLCAQEDRVNVAAILAKSGAETDSKTKAGYTPLHVACHFGQINMVRFLLQQGADVNTTTAVGYTPLHQAAQQGHTLIINLLLENRASPNAVTNQGQTALSIAQRLGYISVVETLKVVTETIITTTTTTITEEKYRVVAPETMQETFMSDSEDDGGDDFMDSAIYGKPPYATHIYLPYYEGQTLLTREDTMFGDQSYQYLTMDEMKSLGDDSMPTMDPLRDERIESHVFKDNLAAPPTAEEDQLSPVHAKPYAQFTGNYAPDNIDIAHSPVHAGSRQNLPNNDDAVQLSLSVTPAESPQLRHTHEDELNCIVGRFLVSFMVDARGGAMRGCRHSGVRVIIPPRKAPMPTRITCRYLKKEKLAHPPPLMEGEACASRILEMGPAGAKFLGPVIIEVPHFASLRGKEREITILRSDNGESWREHTLEATEEAVQEVLNDSFDGEELNALEDLNTNRITRILTTDFPQYFAIVTRVRQEVHAIGPEGGMVSSTVVPQVQAVFPEGALTKKIKVGLQAQPIPAELVAKLLGNRVAVSPIVTVEPRRRKFHKPITLTIPVPQAAAKGMINTYSGDTPTLRLLCSITGGTTRAQWEDVTGSTPLTFVNDCVSFTTTVSARFWLMDCRNISEATKMATELYREAIHVPFMAKFVVFAKRHDPSEARLRVFCMTDDKEEKTLESQENFQEVAKSRDVEVLEAKAQFVEFAGNLVPVTKSGEQLSLHFHAFRENRLPFMTRVRDPHQDPVGRIAFMREPKVGRGEAPQAPICNLNIALPDIAKTDQSPPEDDLLTIEKRYDYLKEVGISKPETIHKAELRLSDISTLLGKDWVPLALQLDIADSDINVIKTEYPDDVDKQAIVMLRLWMQVSGNKATGNTLEKALRKINREDIVNHCIFNVELVTDDVERAVAKVHLDQSGFETLKEELGPSREASLRRDTSLDASYDEQDIMKAESAEETSSEAGSLSEHPAPAPAPEIIVSADRKARKAEEETEDDEMASPLVPPRRSKKIVAFEQDIVSKKTEPVRTESAPVQKREKKVTEESPQVEEDETAEGVCVPKRRSVTDIVSQFEVISDKGNGTASKTEKIQAETDVLELLKMFDSKKEEKPRKEAKPVIVTEIYKPLVVEEDTVVEEIPEDIEDLEIIEAQASLVEKASSPLNTIEDVVTHQAHVLKYELPDIPQESLIAKRDDGLVTLLESDISSSSVVIPGEQRTEIVTEAQSHEIANESWEDVTVHVDGEHVSHMEAITEVHGDVLVCPVAAAHHGMEEVVGILQPLESGAVEAVASLTPKDEEREIHFQKTLHHELPLLQQQQSLSELYVRDDVKVEELITFGDYEKQMRDDISDDDDDGQEELMQEQGILQAASGKPSQLLIAESSEQVQVHEKPPVEQLVGAKTPPSSPVETTQVQVSGVDGKVTTVTTTTKSESGDGGLTKQTVVTRTTVVGQKAATGEPLEAARLAEAEYWASQELERITPDLLDSSRDSQGMVSEEEPITDGHVVKEEWIEKDDSGNVTRKVTKISYDSHKEFPDAHALPEGSRAVGGPASVADEKGDANEMAGEQDKGVVEESIPFGKKKEFFESLTYTKETTMPVPMPRKISPPSTIQSPLISTTTTTVTAHESEEIKPPSPPVRSLDLVSDVHLLSDKEMLTSAPVVATETIQTLVTATAAGVMDAEKVEESRKMKPPSPSVRTLDLVGDVHSEVGKEFHTSTPEPDAKDEPKSPISTRTAEIEEIKPSDRSLGIAHPDSSKDLEKFESFVIKHTEVQDESRSTSSLGGGLDLVSEIHAESDKDIDTVDHELRSLKDETKLNGKLEILAATGITEGQEKSVSFEFSEFMAQEPEVRGLDLVHGDAKQGTDDHLVTPLDIEAHRHGPESTDEMESLVSTIPAEVATKETFIGSKEVQQSLPPGAILDQMKDIPLDIGRNVPITSDVHVKEAPKAITILESTVKTVTVEPDGKSRFVESKPPLPPGRSLDLVSSDIHQETGDDLCITTPDLETPKDGPEAAGKSDKQKMIEVTERVAEVACTLASTLEKVEMSIPQQQHQEQAQQKPDDISKWQELEVAVEDSRRVADLLESQLHQEEELAKDSLLDKSVDIEDRTIPSSGDGSVISDSDEGRAIKAEIKLLVKTTGEGKEAIEIRSIREFVDSSSGGAGASASSTSPTSSLGRIFAEAASPTAPKSPPIAQLVQDQSPPQLASLSFPYEEPPHFGRGLEETWGSSKLRDSAMTMSSEDKPSWSSSAMEEEHAGLMTEGPTMIFSKEGHDDHEVTSDTSDSHQEQDSQLREDMQQILENFMAEDQHDHPNNYQDS